MGGTGRAPHAIYALVQTVLVREDEREGHSCQKSEMTRNDPAFIA